MKLRKQAVMNKFYESWWFLDNHPMNREDGGTKYKNAGISHGLSGLDIFVVMVCPLTKKIHTDIPTLNTEVAVWLEFGPVENNSYRDDTDDLITHYITTHDPRLDVGAPTFEEAIIKLAAKVKEYYG